MSPTHDFAPSDMFLHALELLLSHLGEPKPRDGIWGGEERGSTVVTR